MASFRIPVDLFWNGASGSPGVNVWHVRDDQTVPPFDSAQEVVDLIHAFYTAIQSNFPTTWTARFQGTADVLGSTDGETQTFDPWSVSGISTSSFAPPSNQILVSWKAQTGKRRGQGRTFLGPFAANAIGADGRLETSRRASMQSAVDTLVSSSTGTGNGAIGIYSRVDSLFRDIVLGTVRADLSVLRSRRD